MPLGTDAYDLQTPKPSIKWLLDVFSYFNVKITLQSPWTVTYNNHTDVVESGWEWVTLGGFYRAKRYLNDSSLDCEYIQE